MARRLPLAAQVLVLAAASAALAALAQATLPHRIPWSQDWSNLVENKAAEAGVGTIPLDRMQRIVEQQDHILLDARKMADYLAGHIPGSFSLPDSDFDAQVAGILPLLTPSQPIVVYCSGKACDESIAVANKLKAQGITNVVVYVGGIAEWTAAGGSIQR